MKSGTDILEKTKVIIFALLFSTLLLCICFWLFYSSFEMMVFSCLALVCSFVSILLYFSIAKIKKYSKKNFNYTIVTFFAVYLVSFLVFIDRFIRE